MIYLDNNEITTLHKNAFGKINVLSLLSLSNNNINNISVGAFENVRQLISLDLSYNNLTFVSPGAFASKNISVCVITLFFNSSPKTFRFGGSPKLGFVTQSAGNSSEQNTWTL